jgi:hypothetical protein
MADQQFLNPAFLSLSNVDQAILLCGRAPRQKTHPRLIGDNCIATELYIKYNQMPEGEKMHFAGKLIIAMLLAIIGTSFSQELIITTNNPETEVRSLCGNERRNLAFCQRNAQNDSFSTITSCGIKSNLHILY